MQINAIIIFYLQFYVRNVMLCCFACGLIVLRMRVVRLIDPTRVAGEGGFLHIPSNF